MSSRVLFEESIEGAQHGGKGLAGFGRFAMETCGAPGGIVADNVLVGPDGTVKTAETVRSELPEGFRIHALSMHCLFWVMGTAWTQSKTIRPFIPENLHAAPVEKIRQWAEDRILALLDLSADLNNKLVAIFWGVYQGWEAATGYPWGLFSGQGYDLLSEGQERFVKETQKVRDHARSAGIKLCHEVHRNSAAKNSAEVWRLLEICDKDPCLAVLFDPSHRWEGESVETMLRRLADLICLVHVKDCAWQDGEDLTTWATDDWTQRPMYFTALGEGKINLEAYVRTLISIGYAQRYCAIQGTEKAPLPSEAEAAHMDLDTCAQNGVHFIRERLIYPVPSVAFDRAMGAST